MAKKARSAYWSADDADAKISMARSVLRGVQTSVEYNFFDADYGQWQCIIKENAGDIQVMLNVVQNLLGQAEEALKEITEDTKDNGGERKRA